MPKNHNVEQGECTNSIAYKEGVLPTSIWDEDKNTDIKKDRVDQNVLMPGDTIVIPDIKTKDEQKQTDSAHKFKLKNALVKLQLILKYHDEPLKNKSYKLTLDINQQNYAGQTKDDGKIEVSIPVYAKTGELTVGKGEEEIKFKLNLGHLNPPDKVSGIKQRLHNLGYDIGKIDDIEDKSFENVLKLFESENELPHTGKSDANNQAKLKDIYGR